MAVWHPTHKLIAGLDKYCSDVRLNLRNLSGHVDVPSLSHSRCLSELCYQALHNKVLGPAISDILDIVLSSANLQTLELKTQNRYREISIKDFAIRDIRRWPLLQEIRLVGRVFDQQSLNQLGSLVDWSRIRRLKIGPFQSYRTFLKRLQAQFSHLEALAIVHNKSERLPVRNWSGDIGRPYDDEYAPPIYYSSLLNLNILTELLLANGADVNAHGGRYEYPLQAAVYSGDLPTVKLLLHHGAHVNAKSRIMGNALQMAACKSDMAMILLLLDYGADFVSPGVMFDDVIQISLHQHDVDLIIKFILAGAPIRIPERNIGSGTYEYGHKPNHTRTSDESISGSAPRSVFVNDSAEGTSGWAGQYSLFQTGKEFDTSFNIRIMSHVVLDGELPFCGTGEDGADHFEIYGRTTLANGLVSFVEIHASSHRICSGQLQADGDTLNGHWGTRKGDSGAFKVVRVHDGNISCVH